jgi:hypothetical protein
MASVNFPKKGARVRRRIDGAIGEVYASDPQKDILTVRWRTSTGFETRVCTSEPFARDWELTGTPTQRKITSKTLGWILLLLAVVMLGTFWHNHSPIANDSQPQTTTTSSAAALYSVSVPPGTITLSAEQLETAYGNNEASTDTMYKGKSLLVSGEVDLDTAEDGEQPNVSFNRALPALSEVSISFRPSEKSKLASLFEGDSITVLCTGDGSSNPRHPEFGIPQLADCLLQARQPGANFLLSEQIKAAFVSDDVKLDKYRYSSGTVDCSINTGEWLTVGPTELRSHLSKPLRDLYVLASKFPQVKEIDVTLQSPAAPKKDEYGHDLPAGLAETAFLRIDAGDFRKFPNDFAWDSYPVYVANRYIPSITSVNWSLRDIWKSELSDEIRLGGFQSH